MQIRVEHVTKAFGEFAALDDVSLTIPEGALVALLGPSGSGKTTLLRVIAGLEQPKQGRVLLGDNDITHAPIQSRGIGFVFQDYALFDHMTVADNVAFGLAVRRTPAAEITARVRELLARVQLSDLTERYPNQLSGGQRQRVALARALAPRPRVLLLDEPFGALDARVRAELRSWLRRLHDDLHITSVFVTHDQEEALEVADELVLLDHGRIEQVGTPAEVFDRPASAFVVDFLGGANVLVGEVTGDRAIFADLSLPWTGRGAGPARAFVRGHDLELGRDDREGLPVTIRHVREIGVTARVTVSHVEHGDLVLELPRHRFAELALARGDHATATVRTARVFLDSVNH
jgi:sulfate transport system ATP-binding protein